MHLAIHIFDKLDLMKRLLLSLLWLLPAGIIAQITIDESFTAQELVDDILIGGSCAETSNFISSTGTDFGSVNGIAAFNANGSDFPFESGIILSSGTVADAPGPNLTIQGSGGWPGDADLEANTSATLTNDASFIQFNFTPFTEDLSFNFIMASEEYNQNFECLFSDAFAFILTDLTTNTSENLAVLPGTTVPIEVTNIRPAVTGICEAVNEEFFDRYNFQPFNDENTAATNFNGQTVSLEATSTVIVGNPYTIKLVVADQEDTLFDIAVFLEAGSFNIGTTNLGDDFLIADGTALCEGATVILDATDPDALSYTWFLNDTEIAGETMPTLEATLPGLYRVEVVLTDPVDCVITDSIIIEFIDETAVNIGEDIVACEDALEMFDTGLSEVGATFVWTLDGTTIAGETGSSILASSSGVYEVTVTFDAGCSFSDNALSTVNTLPVVDLGDDINNCLVDPITLDGTLANVDPALVMYQWAFNGGIIAGETSATLEISFPGTYEVFVTVEGCTGSDMIIVTLANPDGSDCSMNDLCLDALPVNCGDIVIGNTTGSSSDGAPTETCGTTAGAPGNWYSFIGTGDTVELALCNSDFDTKIQVYAGTCDALECIGGNDDSCGAQSEFAFLSIIGEEYFIYIFGFGQSTGNYELTIDCVDPVISDGCLDAAPFCSDDGLTFENVSDGSTAQDGIDYGCLITQPNPSWFFLEIEESGDLNLEIVQNTQFDENGNPIGNPLDVDFIAWGPFMDEQSACGMLAPQNEVDCSFSIQAVETFTIPNATVGEIYVVLITNFDGDSGFISLGQTGGTGATNCDILEEFTVDLGEDRVFCSSITPDFEIVPSIIGENLGDASYLWSTGETTETITVSTSDTYTVEVTIDGFTATDAITITFIQEPIVDLGPDQIICEGDTVTFTPVTSGDPDEFTYLWSTGETTQTITVTEAGTYSLTITTVEGCPSTDEVVLSFEAPIVVNAGEDFVTCRNFEATLTATVDDPDAVLQWFLNGDIIDGATATSLDFTPGQTAFGVQEYTLQVTSALGCTSSDTVNVSLYDVGQCVITQGLSPTNGDGLNDSLDLTFLADRTGITNLQIFNRLGRKVFERADYISEWEGQSDIGGELPTGTYFYVINFDSEDPDFGSQATGWIYINRD